MITKVRNSILKEMENEKEYKELLKDCHNWVKKNKGLELVDKGHYTSPRISSEVPDCSLPLSFDQYNFCSLSCSFCFSYIFKMKNPAMKHLALRSVDVDSIIKGIEGAKTNQRNTMLREYFYKNRFVFHWGGMADPFCGFEQRNRVGYKLLKCLGHNNYPTLFSFKGPAIFDKQYVKLFEKYATQNNFAFQISITTTNDKMSRYVEVGAPPVSKRLEAMKMLSDMGYWTVLRLRPFIIGITDEGLEDLLGKALECGMKGISTEFFCLDLRGGDDTKSRINWLGKLMGTDNVLRYFKTLSPSERGGNLRLNRNVKEQFIKFLYKWCVEHDVQFCISDPDFKELCQSGSCCSLPNEYPKNPLLTNWSKNQMTEHLRNARVLYHKTGQKHRFYFNTVYDTTKAPFLLDHFLTNDHVSVSSMKEACRYNANIHTILRQNWNNLHSYSNPRNYFHGKVMPIGIDSDGNIVFEYNPLEYEARWVAEGIPLDV